MRTAEQLEKDIVEFRYYLLEVKRLEFARLFKKLQATLARNGTGKFWPRVKALGFAKTTGQRWMEEYDREVGHRGKTTCDGLFAPEDPENVSVIPNLGGRVGPALPGGKRVFQIEWFVTEEERRQLLDAVQIWGANELKPLILRAILEAAGKGPGSVPL